MKSRLEKLLPRVPFKPTLYVKPRGPISNVIYDVGWLELANGRRVPCVSGFYEKSSEMRTVGKMPVVCGLIAMVFGSARYAM